MEPKKQKHKALKAVKSSVRTKRISFVQLHKAGVSGKEKLSPLGAASSVKHKVNQENHSLYRLLVMKWLKWFT